MQGPAQAMLPALEAILGHRSAHSLATGPVMAEPVDTNNERVPLVPTRHQLHLNSNYTETLNHYRCENKKHRQDQSPGSVALV